MNILDELNTIIYERDAAVTLLKDLTRALDGAFISSWQSTEAWQKQLNSSLLFLERLDKKE